MTSLSTEKTTTLTQPFSHLVVYGHSLDEQDYSYFFPLLDIIRTTEISSASKILFAFSIFGDNERAELVGQQSKAISKLFARYEEYKQMDKEHRLLDSLTAQGRVLMIEIT